MCTWGEEIYRILGKEKGQMKKKVGRKRVAILVHCLFGGGMEHVAAQLSEMLSDAGFDVYLFLGEFHKKKSYPHKGKVVVLPHSSVYDWKNDLKEGAILLYDAYRIKKLKREHQIDVTISFSPMKNLINMLSDIGDKKILTVHSCCSVRTDLRGIYHSRLAFRCYNFSDQIVAVSQWCKKDLIRNYGVSKNKVTVIYNPIEKCDVKSIPIRKENVVLVVGRLQDVKQQWHIVRAFRCVLEQVPDAKLVIAGKGENERYLKQLCREMNLEKNTEFKGYVNDMASLYLQAKCVVFCSASEAFPCSVIEAMSYGVPVVAADCPGGIREIIAREDDCGTVITNTVLVSGGILTPKVDGKRYGSKEPLTKAEKEMAEGIIYILQNEDIREKMSENCYEISKLFGYKKISYQWERILQ